MTEQRLINLTNYHQINDEIKWTWRILMVISLLTFTLVIGYWLGNFNKLLVLEGSPIHQASSTALPLPHTNLVEPEQI